MPDRAAVLARCQELIWQSEAEADTIVGPPLFLRDWPAEDYPEAVEECSKDLRAYVPLRNVDRSYRASARRALEQARYLGLRRIGPLPPTVTRQVAVHTVPRRQQMDLWETA
jgi:hypothetical protein